MRTLRTRLVQFRVRPGHPADNAARLLERVGRARAEGVDLLVFPEMAIPGYLIGDDWEHEAFLRECEACGEDVRAASRGLTVVFGNVGVDWRRKNEDGRVRKYNALFVADDGRFAGPEGALYPFVIKVLQPNYREFDDSRHFFDLRRLASEERRPVEDFLRPVPTRKARLAGLICEDAWDSDYAVSPLAELGRSPADLFVNISASPYTLNKNAKRHRVFAAHARRLGRPLLYVNSVGLQNNGKTVFTFEGESCVYDGRGGVVRAGEPFRESELTLDLPLEPGTPFGAEVPPREDTVADVLRALDYGIGEFMALCGVRRVTVGVSGGIDSAVVAALYARRLAPEDLLLVNMPSRYNSATTRRAARDLAETLGTRYAELPIEDGVALTARQVDGLVVRDTRGGREERLALSGLMMENVQARDRSSRILAAVSAAFGSVFTCNANKSEATVGYTTLYGDLDGYLACLADLWKTEVYALAEHLNRESGREVVPRASVAVTPSAELSPAQNVDEGKGDPIIYPYHDCLFRSWVEWWNRATPEDILEWYAEGALEAKIGYAGRAADLFPDAAAFVADLERWWSLYKGMGLAKRIQAPPVLAVKRRAFGFDHRESQMGPYYTRRYLERRRALLGR